jgi:hypothetical protein
MSIVAAMFVRLTHTGVYEDGRPNTASVTIYDLDEITISKTRERAVPVPPNSFVDIPMSTRTFVSYNEGSIAGLVQRGLITAQLFLQMRDKQHCGGPTADGIDLQPAVLNAERVSNGNYTLTAATPATGLAGPAVGSLLLEMPSVGPDIPQAILVPGTNIKLVDGRQTVVFSSGGDIAGLGANVFGYVAGQLFPTALGGGGGSITVLDESVPLPGWCSRYRQHLHPASGLPVSLGHG